MNNNKIFLYNGIDYMPKHLELIYGERGSLEHNLKRYVESEWFLTKCRQPDIIEDIPEITYKDLKDMCSREEYFSNLCLNVIKMLGSG